jgi:hypothetical protein
VGICSECALLLNGAFDQSREITPYESTSQDAPTEPRLLCLGAEHSLISRQINQSGEGIAKLRGWRQDQAALSGSLDHRAWLQKAYPSRHATTPKCCPRHPKRAYPHSVPASPEEPLGTGTSDRVNTHRSLHIVTIARAYQLSAPIRYPFSRNKYLAAPCYLPNRCDSIKCFARQRRDCFL